MSEDIILQNDNKTDIKEILKVWRNELGLDTYKELAEFLGVTQNTMESWKLRGKIPDKILYQYELSKNKENSSLSQKTSMLPFALDALVALSAKTTLPKSENTELPKPKLDENSTFSKIFFEDSGALQVYKVEDNSMLPRFLKDDFVFFDEKEKSKNGFYLLNINGNLMLRQIIFKSPTFINIKTLDGIEDYEIELSDKVQILGRIVKVLSNL